MHDTVIRPDEVAAETRTGRLSMPRVNANEDGATIVSVPLGPGDRFEAGALLFEVETTKATMEIEAPCAGTVVEVPVEPGRQYDVGAVILVADVDPETAVENLPEEWSFTAEAGPADADGTQASGTSLKARIRARELGVDLDTVSPADGGRITVADVEAHASRGGSSDAASAEPTLREAYGPNDAVMIGEGGHALTVEDAAAGSGLAVVHRLSLRPDPADAGVALVRQMIERGLRTALIGVGGATSNEVRAALFEFLLELGLTLPPIVARGAHLGAGSRLGRATYLFPCATVGPAVTIGDDCIVNHGAVVCHDSVVGSHVHLTPSATIAGACRIGDYATIGMNASVMNGVSVGERALVHNNAAVAQDVAVGAVVTG